MTLCSQLIDNGIDVLEEMIDLTRKYGVKFGSCICSSDDKLILTEPDKGDVGKVYLGHCREYCSTMGYDFVGTIHTHIDDTDFSAYDLSPNLGKVCVIDAEFAVIKYIENPELLRQDINWRVGEVTWKLEEKMDRLLMKNPERYGVCEEEVW